MYSAGEEFEKVINGDEEYFTCLANITVDEKEYLICENESGIKKSFLFMTLMKKILFSLKRMKKMKSLKYGKKNIMTGTRIICTGMKNSVNMMK